MNKTNQIYSFIKLFSNLSWIVVNKLVRDILTSGEVERINSKQTLKVLSNSEKCHGNNKTGH